MTGSGDVENEARTTMRAQQRRDTRERVYEAALAEFMRVGVAQTQIERIVQLAGVSVGTFYRYFPGKDAVLLELQQRLVRDVVLSFKQRSAEAKSLRDLLRIYVECVLAERTDIPLELQREAVALIVRTHWPVPEWGTHPMFGPLTKALAEAQADGAIRADLPPDKLMQLVSTSIFGFSAGVVVASEERLDDARRMVDMIVDALEAGRTRGGA